MSAKRSKTAQRLDAIVSNPKTISDVMIAIDRLRYHLERIEETSTTIQVNAAPTSEQTFAWLGNYEISPRSHAYARIQYKPLRLSDATA
jgi:hypothetical protein